MLTDVLAGRASNRVMSIDGQTVTGNGLINSPAEVGGWPELDKSQAAPEDSDLDGMPDSWEDDNNLNKFVADDRNDDRDNEGIPS